MDQFHARQRGQHQRCGLTVLSCCSVAFSHTNEVVILIIISSQHLLECWFFTSTSVWIGSSNSVIDPAYLAIHISKHWSSTHRSTKVPIASRRHLSLKLYLALTVLFQYYNIEPCMQNDSELYDETEREANRVSIYGGTQKVWTKFNLLINTILDRKFFIQDWTKLLRDILEWYMTKHCVIPDLRLYILIIVLVFSLLKVCTKAVELTVTIKHCCPSLQQVYGGWWPYSNRFSKSGPRFAAGVSYHHIL